MKGYKKRKASMFQKSYVPYNKGMRFKCDTASTVHRIVRRATSMKSDNGPAMLSGRSTPRPEVTQLCSNLRLRLKHADWLILSVYSGLANQLA